jgi:hypothetical protein
METISKTLNKKFDFKAQNVGLFLDDNLWVHDKWIVTINGETFDYMTGIGHRTELNRFCKDDFNRIKNQNPTKSKSNLLLYIETFSKVSKSKPLDIDDVLYSLLSDATFGSYSFDDFCDELGYDNDSIKATEIYKACQKNAKKVKTFISNIDEAQELFSEY